MKKLILFIMILFVQINFAQKFYIQDSLQTVLTGLRSATSSLNTAVSTLDRVSTQLNSTYTKVQIDAMVLNLQSQINELYERLGNLNPTIPQPVTNLAVNTIYNDSIKYSFTNPTSNFDSIQF